ncbi:hypothetical protein ABN034_12440 [Actinopolymorpha sp. B11F2]|uniref:hypothetical protein n=1 Tax=Actinopolymorpha sp. B11F2 TaxID=3160862 RepID=UPI0032E4FE1C
MAPKTGSKHRERTRIVLPDGTWINLYDDGEILIARYNSRVDVSEILTRGPGQDGSGAAHVRMRFVQDPGLPEKRTVPRDDDVTI